MRRLKSDYQYSAGIVYNNFPWAQETVSAENDAVARAARGSAFRSQQADRVYACGLIRSLSMPPELLLKQHPATG